jgi:hypothetical protein
VLAITATILVLGNWALEFVKQNKRNEKEISFELSIYIIWVSLYFFSPLECVIVITATTLVFSSRVLEIFVNQNQ